MMRAKTALASLSLLLALSLSGCGSDSALTDYTSQIQKEFCTDKTALYTEYGKR